jgi:hypothetical protein
MDYAASTETLKLKAGDTLEFALARGRPSEYRDVDFNCPDGRGFCTYEPFVYKNVSYTELYVSGYSVHSVM